MEKRIALFAVASMIVGVSGSAVLALSPMGPPKASLGQDQWAIGIEYANETMDLESFGTDKDIEYGPTYITTRKGKHNINDLKSNIVLGRVSYGISDNWDAFLRLGVADAQGDIEQTFTNAPSFEYRGFDGSYGFAWGFGTKVTIWEDEDVSWGGLLQMTWVEPGDSSISLEGDSNYSGNAEIEFCEVQIAIGPTWRIEDNFSIYGGPFLHYVNGDLDFSGRTVELGSTIDMVSTGDIEEKSQFGGYIGASLDANERTSYFLECQFTGDAWGIGIGAARRF
jgi:hypothetical protein